METLIFLCECGGNISGPINLDRIQEEFGRKGKVFIHPFLCSPDGQTFMLSRVQDGDRVLIGACSPHLHSETFKDLLSRKDICCLRIAAIREEAAWTGGRKAEEKALRLLKGAFESFSVWEPLRSQKIPLTKSLLVLGGGIAGISAALKAAAEGLQVYLVEKEAFLGGKAVFLDRLYPRLECASCVVAPKLSAITHQKGLEIFTLARVFRITGVPGNYEVELELRPRYVDLQKCNGCGKCLEVCPVTPPAIYFGTPHPVPRAPVINPFSCLQLTGKSCGKCLKVCPVKAIHFEESHQRRNLKVGGILVATGFRPYSAEKIPFYGYQDLPGVLTLFDLEKILVSGQSLKGCGGDPPQRVAIVHCVGSRDRKYLPYCSDICCGLALKAGLRLREDFKAEVYHFYLDLRLKDQEGENLYARAREAGIRFIRGRVAEISDAPFSPEDQGRLVLLAEDTLLSRKLKLPVDMVVLVPGFVPEFGSEEVGQLLGLSPNEFGFFEVREKKTAPVESLRKGIWLAGAVSGPKDIAESVISAEAAALEAISFLSQEVLLWESEWVSWEKERCGKCLLCVETCPYQALRPTASGIKIISEFCTGCGICVTSCPSKALKLKPLPLEGYHLELEALWS